MKFAQITEKVTHHLSVVFSSDFKSSCDPQKGYGATFADFIARSQDINDVRPDGTTVVIDSSGKSVAEQMWDSVRSVTRVPAIVNTKQQILKEFSKICM